VDQDCHKTEQTPTLSWEDNDAAAGKRGVKEQPSRWEVRQHGKPQQSRSGVGRGGQVRTTIAITLEPPPLKKRKNDRTTAEGGRTSRGWKRPRPVATGGDEPSE